MNSTLEDPKINGELHMKPAENGALPVHNGFHLTTNHGDQWSKNGILQEDNESNEIEQEKSPMNCGYGVLERGNDEEPDLQKSFDIDDNYIECEDFTENVRCRNPRHLGLFYGKFLEAFLFRTFFYRAATYPFFGVYLNMAGHSYTSIYSIFQLFWSLKFFVGIISDTKLLFGKPRIYYITIGWLISGIAFACTLLIPYPESYYSVDECKLNKTSIQNEDAPDSGNIFALALGIAAFGASMSDCCSDALSVDYTKRENSVRRGRTITGSLVTANLGAACLYLIIGFGLNSPAFGGTDCDLPITYRHILMFYLIICILGMGNSLLFTYDFPIKQLDMESPFKTKLRSFWALMQDRTFQRCAVMFLLTPAFRLQSSGAVKIRKNWAAVEPLAGSVTAAVCAIIGAFGISAYQKFFVHKNWIYSYVLLKSFFFSITLLVDALTIFDVVRNQYFYFAEDLADSIHLTFGACVLSQVAAEISGLGLEALTFSMFMSNWTVSNILGRIISNLISAPFKVIDDDIYTKDESEDRLRVFGSVVAVFVFNLISLLAIVFLCPKQKNHVHQLRRKLGNSVFQAKLYLCLFVVVYLFSIIYLILLMNKNTQCLLILGGSGCDG